MSSTQAFNSSGSLAAGTLVGGRYRIVRRLETGAFRVSYLATAVRATSNSNAAWSFRRAPRDVVIEVYKHDDSSFAVSAWQRQASVLEALEHPGLPKYYSHERLPSGELALVRASAVGRTLQQRIDDKERWGTDRVSRLARQLLDVLAYLHEQNPPIVHGDITPSNVVLDDDDNVQLLGLRPNSETRGAAFGVTPASSVWGHAAPEPDVGRRHVTADLYSVGAVLASVLSRLPVGELPIRGGVVDVGSQAGVEPWLAAWLTRLVASNPGDRFGSATEALRALAARARNATTSSSVDEPWSMARSSYAARGARVGEPGRVNAAANAFGLRGPVGTRVVAHVRGETLEIELGGVGFGGRGSRGGLLAWVLWTGVISVFTAGLFLVGAGAFGSWFIVPFWGASVVLGLSVAFTMWGKITIRVGPGGASVSRQLWAWSRHQQAPLAHWSGARVVRVTDQGPRFKCCITLGVSSIWFGHGLSLAEQDWLTDLLNGWAQRCLGVSANG